MVSGRSCIWAAGLALARARQVRAMCPRSFSVGAELEHVALGHHGEDLARGEQAVRDEELVVGAVAADGGLRSIAGSARSGARSGR